MRFFQNKYIKVLSLSLFVGALAIFFVGDKLWAAFPRAQQAPIATQDSRSVDRKLLASPKGSAAGPVKNIFVQKMPMRSREAGNIQKKPVGGTQRIANVRRTIGKQALERQQDIQAKHYGVDTRPLTELENQTSKNKFTQSEAHLQIKSVRDILSSKPSSVVIPFLDTVADCLAMEARLKDTHYVFYHTTENAWRVTQDLYTQLYAYFKSDKEEIGKEFTFIRFGEYASQPQAKDFLVQELRDNGLVDDTGQLAAILLSVNLALFGNIGFESESSWEYFLREKKHREPDRDTYQEIMKEFGLSNKYVGDLVDLPNLFSTKEKTILQIFIPKDLVDQVAYLAWATGIPAHEDTINWVRTNVKNKVYKRKEGKAGALWALADLKNTFKKQQEKNPLFKDLIKSIEEGDYSVDSFLKIYCNKPSELPNINNTQARLILSPDTLLNPDSNVKVYRYTTSSRKNLEKYSNRLKQIVDKLINEKAAGV